MHGLKRGDQVVVIAGADRGKRGKVLQVLRNKDRVVVEGVAFRKKHMKKTQENPNGSIEKREGTLHISNVMQAERYDARHAATK